MKTYKILTLGASGSGKTVFLASLFHQLSVQGDDGFFFEIDNHQEEKILSSVYTNLIAGGIWPAGTKYSEISEWSFTCHVKNTDSLDSYPVCKFVYFDYAGGRFTDMDENDLELQETIRKSDAILGLLDGQRILAFMNSDSDSKLEIFLEKDLPAIVKWMSHCKVPIQFVISKWDLLEGNFSLEQIRDRLLEISIFTDLVRDRNKKGYPVRLIPVSSVGSDFVEPKSDGSMEKRLGAIPHPFQVEVPASCVIPDKIKQDIVENAKREEDIVHQNIDEPGIMHRVFKRALPAEKYVDIVFEIVSLSIDHKLATILVNKFDDLVFSGMKKIVESRDKQINDLKKAKENSIKQVKDETTALESALQSFLYIEEKLTRAFPQSEVSVD